MSLSKRKQFITITCLFLSYCATYANSNTDKAIKNQSFTQLLASDKSVDNFDDVKSKLWSKYVNAAQNLSALKSEYDVRALTFAGQTMRFTLEKRGTAPASGYPLYIALHGGGNTAKSANDSQWRAMEVYYRDSVQNGIYIAPRGISDNWNLHFEKDSYPLYDKMIESAILFDNVDPNRVYLLGFSAGGDGVYAITPRMPDRFAAANMSAGHNNGLTFDNLYNTPFLLQVGELDAAYNRNHVAAENNAKLNELSVKYNGGYLHDVFIHYGGYHNTWRDNDAKRGNQTVLANPDAWLKNNDRSTKSLNSNAIDWLSQHTRTSVPQKLVWDFKVNASGRTYQTGESLVSSDNQSMNVLAKPNALFYWLDASVADEFPQNGKLVVEADKASNTIKINEAVNITKFRILLNPQLLNLAQPIKVEYQGKLVGTVQVSQKLKVMTRTLLERSDPNEIYDAEITLIYNPSLTTWSLS